MNTDTSTDVLQTQFRTGILLAITCLCCSLSLPGKLLAEDQPAGIDLQIQTTLSQLLGEQPASRYQNILDPDKPISWEVYLPDNDSAELPGVMVYISPMGSGQIDSRWREVMDGQNLIYIAANDSGNKVLTIRRVVLATMAVKALGKQFAFDADNIIVAGFSGGGRVASLVASQYPEACTGALYICGVDFWEKKRTPNVARLIQNSFVFLTGSKDFNRMETRKVHKRYTEAGAQKTRLMVIPGMSHEHPDAAVLTEALQFLNGQDQL